MLSFAILLALNPSAQRNIKHTWSQIKAALSEFYSLFPNEFCAGVLIGGSAVLAYKAALEGTECASFLPEPPDPSKTPWLSSDADFVNTAVDNTTMGQISPEWLVVGEDGRQFLQAKGVRLSFVQMPVTFDPEEAVNTALYMTLKDDGKDFQAAVLNPILLYREKQNLVQKGRGKANDPLHMEVAKVYSAYYSGALLNEYLQDRIPTKFTKLKLQVEITRDKAPEIFDEAVLAHMLNKCTERFPGDAAFIKKLFPHYLRSEKATDESLSQKANLIASSPSVARPARPSRTKKEFS